MDSPAWLPGWLRDLQLFGLPPGPFIAALGAALLAYVLMSLLLRVLRSRLARHAAQSPTPAGEAMLEVLGSTQRGLLALASLLIGLGLLDLPDRWAARVGQLWFLALVLQVALWADRLVHIALRRHLDRHRARSGGPVSAAAALMAWGLRTLLWTVVLLGMLSNLGINITAFVASLGVGGIAVALAAQNILGDLFASVSIAIDKPFEVGDFIVHGTGAVSGTVEHVGIKSTRIRSLGGEQIVIANTELLKQMISNYKRLAERRVVFTFGVQPATPPDALAAVPALLKDIVGASRKLRFGRAHFKAIGAGRFDFEVVYTVLDPDHDLYMDEQQRINLALLRAFGERGIALV